MSKPSQIFVAFSEKLNFALLNWTLTFLHSGLGRIDNTTWEKKKESYLKNVLKRLIWSNKAFIRRPQKIAPSSSLFWCLLSKCQNHTEDGATSCGLLKKAELYTTYFGHSLFFTLALAGLIIQPERRILFEACIKKTNLLKFSFSEMATKNCAILLMVSTFKVNVKTIANLKKSST